MTPQALTALKESIEHWKRVVASPLTEKIGPDKCALCNLFLYNTNGLSHSCKGCPIYASTGERFCIDTPYDVCSCVDVRDPRYLISAQRELDFLISLLPPEELQPIQQGV